jgi:hypothetical protein
LIVAEDEESAGGETVLLELVVLWEENIVIRLDDVAIFPDEAGTVA